MVKGKLERKAFFADEVNGVLRRNHIKYLVSGVQQRQ
jgi:hypothetical protein